MAAPVVSERGSIEDVAHVLRRNGYVPLAGLALILGGFGATHFGGLAALLGGSAAVFGCIFVPIVLHRNAWPLARRAALRATPEELVVDGIAPIRTDDITSVRRVHRPLESPSTVLELALRGRRDVTLAVTDHVADDLMSVIGERSSRHRLLVPYGTRFAIVWLALALLDFAYFGIAEHAAIRAILPSLFGTTVLATIIAWALALVRGRIVVGTDGITTNWLGRRRFIPFADVVAVTSKAPLADEFTIDTLIDRRGGKRVRLRTPEEPTTNIHRGIEGRALFDAIRRAYDRARLGARVADARPLLARAGRSSRDWLAALDTHARAAGGYRDVTIDSVTLAEIVADPEAGAEIRVAAAATLVRAQKTELLPRVRVAAEATADPTTRDCLLRIGEARSDEDAVAVLDRVAQRR